MKKTYKEIEQEAIEKYLSDKKPIEITLYHLPDEFEENSLDKYFVGKNPDEIRKNADRIAKTMEENNWGLVKKGRFNDLASKRRTIDNALVFVEKRIQTENEVKSYHGFKARQYAQKIVEAEKAKRKEQKLQEKRKNDAEFALKEKEQILSKLSKKERQILGI